MRIKTLSNDQLLEITKSKSFEERRLILEVIEYLQEIYHRRLHLELGYDSLHTYCVKELGYSDSEAYSRINAMKLVTALPETKMSILEGKLSLTTAAQAQSFFNRQEKRDHGFKLDAKRQVVETLSGLSKREAEKELITLGLECGDTQIALKEKERAVTPSITEVKVFVNNELMSKLNKLKDLLSHKYPNATYLELFEELAEMGLNRLDPERKKTKRRGQRQQREEGQSQRRQQEQHGAQQHEEQRHEGKQRKATLPEKLTADPSKAKVQSLTRYISKPIKQSVWKSAQGRCQYRDPKTNRVCNSTYKLQYEHKVPWSMGGLNTAENLTLFCASHNLLSARHVFGDK